MSKKTLYCSTTKIPARQTASRIQELLSLYGASRIQTRYNAGAVVGIDFCITTPKGERYYALPVRVDSVETLLRKQRRIITDQQKLAEQARNVALRQILHWLEAQLAITQLGMASIDEVFLPYTLMPDGQSTLYQAVQASGLKLIEGGRG